VLVEEGVAVSSSNIDLAALSNDEGFKIAGAAIVGSAGDVNADGFDDAIVGAPDADPLGRTDAGESYVIYGKADGIGDIDLATLTTAQGFKLSGAAAGDASGTSVSRADDVNGDGIEDIIVGAPLADRSGLDHAGESYVIYGKEGGLADIDLAALDPAHGFRIVGPIPPGSYDGSYSGRVVNAAGDINDDGIDDILVGTGSQNFLVYGKAGGLGDVDLGALTAATGANIHGAFVHMIDGGGDINGDGIDDIVVGTRGDALGREDAGETFVIYGKVGGIGDVDLLAFPVTQGFRIAGAEPYGASGYAVSSAATSTATALPTFSSGRTEKRLPAFIRRVGLRSLWQGWRFGRHRPCGAHARGGVQDHGRQLRAIREHFRQRCRRRQWRWTRRYHRQRSIRHLRQAGWTLRHRARRAYGRSGIPDLHWRQGQPSG
jgi:hypothetical protein